MLGYVMLLLSVVTLLQFHTAVVNTHSLCELEC